MAQAQEIYSDTHFLQRLRAREDAAFAELVTQHAPRMLAVAKRYLPDDSDAEDALQDAFISAFNAIDRFEGHSSIGTWLHTVVCRAALMKIRSKKRRKDGVSIEDLLPTYNESGHRQNVEPAWHESADVEAERTETRELVRACIDRLPEDFRTVLMLRDLEGFDTQQTAQMLELNVNAVKTRLHRARQALRKLLQPHFEKEETPR